MTERMLASFAVLAGLAIGLAGCYLVWSEIHLIRCCSSEAVGIVTSVDIDDSNVYRTTIAYSADGVEYVNRLRQTSENYAIYSRGENVAIFYDPLDPNRFCTPGEGTLMIILSLSMVALGLTLMFIFCFKLFHMRGD